MKIFSWDEIKKLNLIVLSGVVYDVSTYKNRHPGGAFVLEKYYGQDATYQFDTVKHSKHAKKLMEKYKVGVTSESVDRYNFQ